MTDKIRILFLSANPWTTSRILVDEEAREVFERIQEGPYREQFELYKHAAIRAIDLQRLLLMYEPHIVHFSGHASKTQKIILGGAPGRGKEIDGQGLVEMFGLYKNHVRLVFLNACFTRAQARSLAEVIDYSVGAGKAIGDKASVAFAGAFYRALGFGRSIKAAFESAKAELRLTKIRRAQGIELFVRSGITDNDSFPPTASTLAIKEGESSGFSSKQLGVSESSDTRTSRRRIEENLVMERSEEKFESQTTIFQTSRISRSSKLIRSESVVYVSRLGRADLSDPSSDEFAGAGSDGTLDHKAPGRPEELLARLMGQET